MGKSPAAKAAAAGKGVKKTALKSAASSRKQTLKQRAGQKLRENLSGLDESQQFVQVYGPTGLTLEETLIADLAKRDKGDSTVVFGKWYYQEKAELYAKTDSIFQSVRRH